MKNILAIITIIFLLSCNNSATVTEHSDADQTKNNDTAPISSDTTGINRDTINH